MNTDDRGDADEETEEEDKHDAKALSTGHLEASDDRNGHETDPKIWPSVSK